MYQSAQFAYRIVYPRGDRTCLSVANVVDYEVDDWSIASSKEFSEEDAAIEHMKYLAKIHGLSIKGDNYAYLLD